MEQYEIFYVNLDPTQGHEIKKSSPCLIISPDEMNRSLQTVIIAPITSVKRELPTRVYIEKQGTRLSKIENWVVLDQIRTVDKSRLGRSHGKISTNEAEKVSATLCEIFKL